MYPTSRMKLRRQVFVCLAKLVVVVYSKASMELFSARARAQIRILGALKIDLTTLSKSATTLLKAIGTANVLGGAIVVQAKVKARILIANATFAAPHTSCLRDGWRWRGYTIAREGVFPVGTVAGTDISHSTIMMGSIAGAVC